MADDPQGARTTGDDARRWLAAMPGQVPGQVAGQRSLLESLITTAQDEPAFRWLELGGSLARGAGDELSDIDAGLGIADDGWDEGLAAAAAAVRAACPVADEFRQRFPGKDGQPAWHLFTLDDTGLRGSSGQSPSAPCTRRSASLPSSTSLASPCHPASRRPLPDSACRT